tara:strand:+ start:17440 stop:18660 length:1221 start_codon:yes stop_codon:yes gene_type:complete
MNWLPIVLRLGLADIWHDRRTSGVLIFGIVSVTVPLLLLEAAREGIVGGMKEQLAQDPASTQIQPVGAGSYDERFLASLKDMEGVRYLIPATRLLASPVEFSRLGSRDRKVLGFMLPSSAGDPLTATIGGIVVGFDEIVLATPIADELRLKVGDRIIGRLTRGVGTPKFEVLERTLRVAGILPPSIAESNYVLMNPAFVYASEAFREHVASPEFSTTGEPAAHAKRVFPSFRLFAKHIEDVEPIRDWLAERGVRTSTRLRQISLVLSLDRTLRQSVLALAVPVAVGLVLTLTLLFWMNVRRKRRELCLLSVIGIPPIGLAVLPVSQAFVLSSLAVALSALLVLLGEPAINAAIRTRIAGVEIVLNAEPIYTIGLGALVILLGALASFGAGLSNARLIPSLGIQDGR